MSTVSLVKFKHKPKAVSLVRFKLDSNRSRANAEKIHFQRRFLERCGYVLSDQAYNDLCAETKRSGVFLKKKDDDPLGRSVFSVKYQGKELKIVYDVYKSRCVTILGW